MISLVKPDYSAAANRFVRWRKKHRTIKTKRPIRVRYWQSREPARPP
jgi:hypothetical protein